MKFYFLSICFFLVQQLQVLMAAENETKCSNSVCYADREEQSLLPKADAFFKRTGLKLELKLPNKVQKKWEDNPVDSDQTVTYRLTSFYPVQKMAVITRIFYESVDHVLISLETGVEFTIDANLSMSLEPDLFVAALGEDYESGSSLNVAKIFYCDPKAKKFCSLLKDFSGYSGHSVKWQKDGEAIFEISKTASEKTRKADALFGSYDIFEVSCKCMPKSCVCTKPKYLKTDSH
jgi:hypothetical protein